MPHLTIFIHDAFTPSEGESNYLIKCFNGAVSGGVNSMTCF